MDCSITVKGHVHERWSASFDGLDITHQPSGETVLSGRLPDQAALHGVLARVRDLGLVLVAVQCTDE